MTDPTAELIDRIAAWQDEPMVRRLTCGRDSAHRPLVAMKTGGTVILGCPDCSYRQTVIPALPSRAELAAHVAELKRRFEIEE